MRWGWGWCLGVCGIDDVFVRGGLVSVLVVVVIFLSDVGVVFGLVVRVVEIGEYVGLEIFVFGGYVVR